MIIYQGNNSPFISRLKNRLEIFNEVCIHAATIHLVFFTDWVFDPELQYTFGWSMICIIVICISGNMIFILWFGFKQLYLLFKKIFLRGRLAITNLWSGKSVEKKQSLMSIKGISETQNQLMKNPKKFRKNKLSSILEMEHEESIVKETLFGVKV